MVGHTNRLRLGQWNVNVNHITGLSQAEEHNGIVTVFHTFNWGGGHEFRKNKMYGINNVVESHAMALN